jgi:enterochelin esterase family protein
MNSILTKLVFLFLLSFVLILLTDCNREIEQQAPSSIIPSKEQLSGSRFAAFINDLKSLPEDQRKGFVQNFLSSNPSSPIIEDSILACFYWFGSASLVLINGDIHSGWSRPDIMKYISCGDEKFFFAVCTLPPDSRVDYQFVVDGKTITDPRNKVISPSGYGFNSQCTMPLFKPKNIREYRANVKHGTIDSLWFMSKSTSIKPRMIKIYKPADYDSLSEFPAVYLNDGFKAIEYCSFINLLDNLIAERKIMPIIAVFIDFAEGDSDYFLNKTDEYITALCDELVLFIDSRYKTSTKHSNRLLTGISDGGHAFLYTALKRSDVFFNAAGQSSTITEKLFNAIDELSSSKNVHLYPKLYFDVGRYDLINGYKDNSFLYANQLFSQELNKAEINYRFRIFNDGHQWANWRERMDEILIYFFRTLPEAHL